MTNPKQKNPIDLGDELKAMPEFKLVNQMNGIGYTLQIFLGNYRELKQLLDFHNDPLKSQGVFSINKRDVLYDLQQEIVRTLHNFVASALSLIDHTRIHYRKLYNEDQFPDYQNEINKRFVDSPIAVFVKDLRSYILHRRLPSISSISRFTSHPPALTRELVMHKPSLESFDWKSPAKAYLEGQEDNINLVLLIDEYHSIITEFYEWYLKRQYKINAEAIEKVRNKKSELAECIISDLIENRPEGKEMSIADFELSISQILDQDEQVRLGNTKDNQERYHLMMQILNQNFNLNEGLKISLAKVYGVEL